MADFKFLNTTRATAQNILEDTRTYITRVYKRAGTLFTSASPFAQILEVLSEIGELLMFYVEDSTVEQNIYTAQQPESIYGLARIAGHDPTRGFAAVGEIEFRWAGGYDKSKIAGDAINIPANAEIKLDTNGLSYVLVTNNDRFRLEKTNSSSIRCQIVQGKIETQTVTGTGESLQSFNIQTTGDTDHNLVYVTVNSVAWRKYDSFYDMDDNALGYIVKTGISGGLDIYFGNGNFGAIPPLGSSIAVQYIMHAGANGNVGDSNDLTVKWLTEGTDSIGNFYDLNEAIQVNVTSAPKMGAARESTEFTKMIAPFNSKSFVLATPDNFEYFLSRYGIFSYIDAYNTQEDQYLDDDNIIYIFATPDINKKLTKTQDYFSIPEREMFFTDDEYNAMLGVIEQSGQQMVTTEVQFVKPKIRKYAMEVSVRYFEGFSKQQIYTDIRAAISEYLLNTVRRDKLPKSDIIYVLEEIDGVDAVNVQFISETEETARLNGFYETETVSVKAQDPVTLTDIGNGKQKYVYFERVVEKNVVRINPGDPIPSDIAGLDVYGDIIMEREEIAIFRGGWNDRDGILIEDLPGINNGGCLNIIFDEVPVPRTIYSRIQSGNRTALK